MFPPAQGLRLDIDAISQIFGSISIACWIGMCDYFPVLRSYTVVQCGHYLSYSSLTRRHSRLFASDH